MTAPADPPLWERFELRPGCELAGTLALARNDIHVWRIDSSDVASVRKAQRRILSAYAPGTSISHDHHGRPIVAGHDIYVTTSYTHEVALFALAARPLGIDVELQREIIGAEAIARTYFATAEYVRWRAERAPRLRFLEYWTRKEAYLKALGRGFAHPPRSVDTSYDVTAGVLVNAADGFESLRWAVVSFHPSSEHTAAIVHARAPDTSFRWLVAAAAEPGRRACARRSAPSRRQLQRA